MLKRILDNHAFSVELHGREHLKTLNIPAGDSGEIIVEGYLGRLLNVAFVEGSMLEIQGVNGTLRLDIDGQEIQKLLAKEVKPSKP
jgi:hypothetical protein